jgi:hypothetical protein
MADTPIYLIQFLLLVLPTVIINAPAVYGQESKSQENTAPPPLKVISPADRSQLTQAKDAKARLRTTIELAEGHLAKAEAHTTQHDFDGAAAAVGRYWALIDDSFSVLKTLKQDSNKTRDLYKRVELSLRAHGPRLSGIRRTTPKEYAVWIKEIEDFARKGRTEALNSFYGHTVVNDPSSKPRPKKQDKPAP